jgi:hypothetical protein
MPSLAFISPVLAKAAMEGRLPRGFAIEIQFSSRSSRNHFNLQRHLIARQVYKQRPLDALAEWRSLFGIGCNDDKHTALRGAVSLTAQPS